MWAERLLMTAGAAALIWCAVFVTDARMAQRTARRSIESALIADRPAVIADRPAVPPAPQGTSGVARREVTVARGAAIAALSIPRVRLSAVVLHGSDERTLRRGPGHLENTAFPGEPGNVVIAGHRDSFFSPLRHIRLGDDIFLDTPAGQIHYQVTSLRVVEPHDLSVLAPADQALLTLITCYPFWVLGHAPDRFVVRATAVVGGTAAPAADGTTAPAAHQATVLHTPVVHDDESLVRQAVERFRTAYNARQASHHDVPSGGALRFRTCEIAVAGDRATAICEAAVPSSSDSQPPLRTFTLERGDREWAIKSIVLK